MNLVGLHAFLYARRGWPVLPLFDIDEDRCACGDRTCRRPGGHPLIRDGVRASSTTERTIEQWWTRWPYANVGVVTGARSGLFVLNIVGPVGRASIGDLMRKHGALPSTLTVAAGGHDRWHLYFAHPGIPVRNATLAPGLDVKGDGGYVVAPPSVRVSGWTYEAITNIATTEPAQASHWVVEMIAGLTVVRPCGHRAGCTGESGTKK